MPDLHTKTITLLAADRADLPLQEAIAAQGGTVFLAAGRACYAAFATPAAALRAALAGQRAQVGPPPAWLRLAIHTGPVSEQEGTYTGPGVSRLASLLGAGHPGQILVSQAVATAGQRGLPDGATLQDLGERRLNDLLARERIYQLQSPDLPAVFPPLQTLDQLPNNLAPQLYPLVGRESEVAAARALLRRPEVRVLTLTGPVGTGKTRLALQIAAELLPTFVQGAWYVPLATIENPSLVAPAIAGVLGIKESGSATLAVRLPEVLREQQILLILDNFERLVGAAPLVAALVAAAPGLKILVTSREVLRLAGEATFAVPPLALPDLQQLPAPAALAQLPAIALFLARAQEADPGFALTAENASAVAEICTRLDGLPLAIELAAARSKQLPPVALLARLGGMTRHASLPVLTSGAPHLPARQQTLRGAIGWSYALLAPAEQQLFARLGVFAGGCTVAAAAAIGGSEGLGVGGWGSGEGLGVGSWGLGTDERPQSKIQNPKSKIESVLVTQLTSLVDKSLLRREVDATGTIRYRMLETIREYALEQLEDDGEALALRQRHAVYYLALAEAAAAQLAGPQQGPWLTRLEVDHQNLRAALTWCRMDLSSADLGIRLVTALGPFWNMHGYLSEGRQWLEGALALGGGIAPARQLAALQALSALVWAQGDITRAAQLGQESLALAQQLGDRHATALALNQAGNVAYLQGDYAQAGACYAESMQLRRALGDRAAIAASLHNLGIVALAQGDHAGAVAALTESLAWQRAGGDARSISLSLTNLAEAAVQTGDYDRARSLYEESLALRQQIGDKTGLAASFSDLGDLARVQGRLAEAEALLSEGLTLSRELGDQLVIARVLYKLGNIANQRGDYIRAGPLLAESLVRCRDRSLKPDIVECLIGLAITAAASGRPERAARLCGAAATLQAALGSPRSGGLPALEEHLLQPARQALGAAAWAAAQAAGAA
ncbi:MAG TPA: tetratricopeptide repeat protein, partial [Chloroflexia bacterium]|nr:tetratricopeptide repeat protein [Chloroflexia bacterium]